MDAAALLLLKQLREFNRHPVEGISAGLIDDSDPYAWNVILVGPSDTYYEGQSSLVSFIQNIIIFANYIRRILQSTFGFSERISY